jgi:hypothetical protein
MESFLSTTFTRSKESVLDTLAASSPRILLWDIETSHNLLAKFDLREEYTAHTNIVQERFIICAAWKLLGANGTQTVSILDDPKRFARNSADDRHVIETLHKVLSNVDVLVHHNGDRFDLPYFNGRALFHKLPPLPPIRTIDTLKVAKRAFMLNSNRLDYIGKYLGLGGKISTPGGLWLEVLKGNAKAVKTMVTYNKHDVELLEDIFLILRPYVPDYINRQFFGGRKSACPKCGSSRVQSRGFHHSITQSYRRFVCNRCHGWFRTRTAEKFKTTTRPLP